MYNYKPNPAVLHFQKRMRERHGIFVGLKAIKDIVYLYEHKMVKISSNGKPDRVRMIIPMRGKNIPIIFDTKIKLPITCFE